jgi:hypothetical protein
MLPPQPIHQCRVSLSSAYFRNAKERINKFRYFPYPSNSTKNIRGKTVVNIWKALHYQK